MSERSTPVAASARVSGDGPRVACRSADGRLDLRLRRAGAKGNGTTFEQLLAAAWAASFFDALAAAAAEMDVTPPGGVAVEASVRSGDASRPAALAVRIAVVLPRIARPLAERLVESARSKCPLCAAARGGLGVAIEIVAPRPRGL